MVQDNHKYFYLKLVKVLSKKIVQYLHYFNWLVLQLLIKLMSLLITHNILKISLGNKAKHTTVPKKEHLFKDGTWQNNINTKHQTSLHFIKTNTVQLHVIR